MYRGGYRGGIKQTEGLEIWLDVLGLCQEVQRKTQKRFDRSDRCQEVQRGVEIAIEEVSISRGNTWKRCKHDNNNTNQPSKHVKNVNYSKTSNSRWKEI